MATTAATKPTHLRIRAYQVGFGDCFLLTFKYPKATKKADKERHVLVDFGSTGMPPGVIAGEQMMNVARDIEKVCKPKLHVVVATHRHKDHISGFTTKEDGSGTGDVIAALDPSIVIQPWTEDPDTPDPKPAASTSPATRASEKGLNANQQHLSSLRAMNYMAEAVRREVANLSSENFRKALGTELADQIDFLSEDNSLPNKSAVTNLAGMGKNHYVNFGYKLNLAQLLPGVKVHVLGPPDINQHADVRKQRSSDEDEFWMLHAAAESFWNLQSATGKLVTDFLAEESHLFPNADVYQDYFPSHDRWFIRRLRSLRGQQLLGLVRALDKAMNNTSVILLFEVGGKKFLFPGDAQIENWEYALNDPKAAALLADVYLYKVGHHGSRNATPRSLWKNFSHKNKDGKTAGRLQTVISTMKGKHGHSRSHTEVPRSSLVNEMKNLSNYRTTEEAADNNKLFVDLEIPL